MKWFVKNWAKVGGGITLLILLYVLFYDLKLSNIESLLWLHFATLLIHQFEEYVYPGGFKEFFNENIYNKNRIIKFPLNDGGVIFVNVILGWAAYLVSAINGEKFLWLAIGLLGVTIFNGILHTFMAIIKRKYNPGFISGLFLLIPFGIFVLLRIISTSSVNVLGSGFLIFLIGTALIPFSIYLTNKLRKSRKN